MKTSITSNWRPLLRVFYVFLLAAVLWAMPRDAGAQVYVTQFVFIPFQSWVVSEYDATTGDPINASFITELVLPIALAVSNNNLFVLNHVGRIVEYDATTGDPIGLIPFLDRPTALAVKGAK